MIYSETLWNFTGESSGTAHAYFESLMQDCINSIANVLELLQSCTKPSIVLGFFILVVFVIALLLT